MKGLEELMTLPGAIAAFECSASGTLQKHLIARGSELRADILDLVAHMCAANLSIATMQARGWELTTHTSGFYPIRNFTLVGMDWSVSIVGTEELESAGPRLLRGVICGNRKVDYQAVSEALSAS
jgi:roadblock/LC7 domain-containing protein